jgi:hypothetical protein
MVLSDEACGAYSNHRTLKDEVNRDFLCSETKREIQYLDQRRMS